MGCAPVPTLWTIGYEDHTPDSLVAALTAAGIERLVDIRETPVLRGKKGMGTNQLRDRLAKEGIRYELRRGLGVPKEVRDRYRQDGDFAALAKWYAGHLDAVGEQVAAVALAATEERVCLACAEADAGTCHRSLLARRLESAGFRVANL